MVALTISLLAVGVAALIVAASARMGWRAAGVAAATLAVLMTVQWRLAEAGIVRQWERVPPPLVPLVLVAMAVALAAALSPFGGRLVARVPLAAVVGFQAFRLPLELAMHRAALDGLMPVQMSYSGWNFDIVTGVSAVVVAGLMAADVAPRGLVVLWNALGSVLLVTIVAIAVASTPMFAAFGPDRLNTWVADAPYVWLPGVLVPAALFGHLVTWRALVLRWPEPRSAAHR